MIIVRFLGSIRGGVLLFVHVILDFGYILLVFCNQVEEVHLNPGKKTLPMCVCKLYSIPKFFVDNDA